MTTVCATSDLHGFLPTVPPCDLLLIAGDICPVTSHDINFQHQWLKTRFCDWLKQVPAKHIVGIAGNHDLIFDHGNPPLLPWVYLEDGWTEIEGLRIYGTPYQSKFGCWPFMRSERELNLLWMYMGPCDILLSHGPPLGAGDRTNSGEESGMEKLRKKLARLKIPVCVCGHIHEAYGVHQSGKTRVYNVSHVNADYVPCNPVVKFEITRKEST
jgi:hypothetical protein